MTEAEIKELKRQNRRMKNYLRELTTSSILASATIDYLMNHTPSDKLRGERIAEAINKLDMQTDAAAHFGLALTFPQIARARTQATKHASGLYPQQKEGK